MIPAEHIYIIIDLKSFYASVECVERGLDPMTANLAVADAERGPGTICLAITPNMKKLGIKNRCRLFEIPSFVKFITAVPRMQLYIDYAARIYEVYLKYIAKEDIFVYSIDEAFMEVTPYLALYKTTPKELALRIMADIRSTVGITATCGIGTNLFLAKIALDILAKHVPDHIGILDEAAYHQTLWTHQPLTDFWMIGHGTARKLEQYGITTMQQIAQRPPSLLHKLFGVNAEILIDHANGREPTTIADIKAYRPQSHSLANGQVLPRNYSYEEGLLIIKEMADQLCLDLVDQELVTDSVTLYIGYAYNPIAADQPMHATARLPMLTNSSRMITHHLTELYQAKINRSKSVRRISINANRVVPESCMQTSLFSPHDTDERENARQRAILAIKKRFGSNAIFRGMDMLDPATTLERNNQIGGHKK